MKDPRFDDEDGLGPTLAELKADHLADLLESAWFEAGIGLPTGEIMGGDFIDCRTAVRTGGHDGRVFVFNPKNRSSH